MLPSLPFNRTLLGTRVMIGTRDAAKRNAREQQGLNSARGDRIRLIQRERRLAEFRSLEVKRAAIAPRDLRSASYRETRPFRRARAQNSRQRAAFLSLFSAMQHTRRR